MFKTSIREARGACQAGSCTLKFDNGPEFASLKLARWAADRNIDMHFIDAGKPMQTVTSRASIAGYEKRASTRTIFQITPKRRTKSENGIAYECAHSAIGWIPPIAYLHSSPNVTLARKNHSEYWLGLGGWRRLLCRTPRYDGSRSGSFFTADHFRTSSLGGVPPNPAPAPGIVRAELVVEVAIKHKIQRKTALGRSATGG